MRENVDVHSKSTNYLLAPVVDSVLHIFFYLLSICSSRVALMTCATASTLSIYNNFDWPIVLKGFSDTVYDSVFITISLNLNVIYDTGHPDWEEMSVVYIIRSICETSLRIDVFSGSLNVESSDYQKLSNLYFSRILHKFSLWIIRQGSIFINPVTLTSFFNH